MRKWLVVLMTAAAVGATGLLGWMYVSQDRKGPEITIDESKKGSYTEGMTAEELLDGVKATDDKDGDVSDTLTVQNVYPSEQGDEVTVIYVAKDKSNNVTKVTYHMTSDAPLSGFTAGTEEGFTEGNADRTSAASNTAGTFGTGSATGSTSDETDDAEGTSDTADVTVTPEAEMTEEEKAQEREEAKIDKLSPQDPRFYLTTYYVEINRGTQIDRLSYVKDIEDDVDQTNELYRKIQITGTVDVYTPGTYELTYYVVDSNGNASNGAVLTIVVK